MRAGEGSSEEPIYTTATGVLGRGSQQWEEGEEENSRKGEMLHAVTDMKGDLELDQAVEWPSLDL